MSLQDDYFDINDTINAIVDRRQRKYMRAAWGRVKKRLRNAKRAEDQLRALGDVKQLWDQLP